MAKIVNSSHACVSTLPMLAYNSGSFGNEGQPFSPFCCKTATTEFTGMSFVFFIRAAAFCVFDWYFPSRIRAIRDGSRFCANDGVLIPLSF